MIIRQLFILMFMLTVTQVFSQNKNYENVYFVKIKVYHKEFNQGVPFAEICITDKKDDFIFNCINTDFDGYAIFYINPNKYSIDSTYLRIRILKGYTNSDYEKPINIPLNRISILKDFNLGNDNKITLTDYKLLNEKEYRKYKKKYGLMPERQPKKAIDVR